MKKAEESEYALVQPYPLLRNPCLYYVASVWASEEEQDGFQLPLLLSGAELDGIHFLHRLPLIDLLWVASFGVVPGEYLA